MIVPSWDGDRAAADNGISGDGVAELKAKNPITALPLGTTGRTASVSSMKSTDSMTKKGPPMKPQKPAMLSSSPRQPSAPQIAQASLGKSAVPAGPTTTAVLSKPRSDSNPPPLPSRTNTSSSIGSFVSVQSSMSTTVALKKSPPPPVQPRRVSNIPIKDPKDSTQSIRSQELPGPPLPPRRVETNKGLMDEDTSGGNMQDWKPLQPK